MEAVKKVLSREVLAEFFMELGRVVLVAIIPMLIISFEAGKVDVRLVFVTGAVAALKAVDRALHESGVAERGLTRF